MSRRIGWGHLLGFDGFGPRGRLAPAAGRSAPVGLLVLVVVAVAGGMLGVAAGGWASPEEDCTEILGQWGYGLIRMVETHGDLLFYSMGGDLVIADIGQPSSPVVLRRLNLEAQDSPDGDPIGIPVDITIVGDLAYVATWPSVVTILDVGDPERASVVGEIAPGIGSASLQSISMASGSLLVGTWRKTGVFDLSYPLQPELVTVMPWSANGLAVVGGVVYLAGDALRVVDFSNPASPVLLGSAAVYGDDVTVRDGLAFVGYRDGVHVVDVTDPTQPVELSHFETPGSSREVALLGPYAYVPDSHGGLRVVDVSDPALPVEVDVYEPPGSVQAVAVTPQWAYVGVDFGGLRVASLADPAHPVEVGTYTEQRAITEVEVVGTHVVAADRDYGLRVLDARDPAAITQVGEVADGISGCLAVESVQGAVVATCSGGVLVVDVEAPENPVVLSSLPPSGRLAHHDTWLFATAYRGFYVADLHDLSNPSVVSAVELERPSDREPATVFGIGASEGLVYAVGEIYEFFNDYGSLFIVDVSDASQPRQVGYFEIEGYYGFWDVDVYGHYAYVTAIAGPSPDLLVIDVSSSAKPRLVRLVGPLWDGGMVKVVNGRLYVTQSDPGFNQGRLLVFDLADPSDPQLIGSYFTAWDAYDVAVSCDHRAYIADGWAGMQVIEVADCQRLLFNGFESGDTSGWGSSLGADGR